MKRLSTYCNVINLFSITIQTVIEREIYVIKVFIFGQGELKSIVIKVFILETYVIKVFILEIYVIKVFILEIYVIKVFIFGQGELKSMLLRFSY